MMDGMGSMMGWMMGIGLLGWVLVIALLVTILVVLVQALSRRNSGEGSTSSGSAQGSPRHPRAPNE